MKKRDNNLLKTTNEAWRHREYQSNDRRVERPVICPARTRHPSPCDPRSVTHSEVRGAGGEAIGMKPGMEKWRRKGEEENG